MHVCMNEFRHIYVCKLGYSYVRIDVRLSV